MEAVWSFEVNIYLFWFVMIFIKVQWINGAITQMKCSIKAPDICPLIKKNLLHKYSLGFLGLAVCQLIWDVSELYRQH